MRQAGVIAAAGIVALETMVERLSEDHSNARYLVDQVNSLPGFQVDMSSVESNMVLVDHTPSDMTTDEVIGLLEQHGVLVSPRPPGNFRMVTSRHHSRETVDEVVRRMAAAAASLRP